MSKSGFLPGKSSSAINNSEAKICKEFLSFYEKKIKNILIHIKKKKFKEYESYIGGGANKIDVKSLPLIQENEAPFYPLPWNHKDSKATERIEEYDDIMDEFFDQNEKNLHEKMGNTIVKIILEDSIDQITEEDANE